METAVSKTEQRGRDCETAPWKSYKHTDRLWLKKDRLCVSEKEIDSERGS